MLTWVTNYRKLIEEIYCIIFEPVQTNSVQSNADLTHQKNYYNIISNHVNTRTNSFVAIFCKNA